MRAIVVASVVGGVAGCQAMGDFLLESASAGTSGASVPVDVDYGPPGEAPASDRDSQAEGQAHDERRDAKLVGSYRLDARYDVDGYVVESHWTMTLFANGSFVRALERAIWNPDEVNERKARGAVVVGQWKTEDGELFVRASATEPFWSWARYASTPDGVRFVPHALPPEDARKLPFEDWKRRD
jgi:hypothetical protein